VRPRSRVPKQYLRLVGTRSLLRQTLDRIALAIPDTRTLVVTPPDPIDKPRVLKIITAPAGPTQAQSYFPTAPALRLMEEAMVMIGHRWIRLAAPAAALAAVGATGAPSGSGAAHTAPAGPMTSGSDPSP
jgi:hypothetical protein